MIVGEEKKRVEGKRENSFFLKKIILLGNLYYFIELYVKIKTKLLCEL